MGRTAWFVAAISLAEFALFALPGVASAENTPWELSIKIDPVRGYHRGSVTTKYDRGGGQIRFSCMNRWSERGFHADVITSAADYYTGEDVKVEWRTDNGDAKSENWRVKEGTVGGITIAGKRAFKFALAVARAKNQIVFRTPNDTIRFGVKGAAESIRQLTELCSITSANNSPWKFVTQKDSSTGEDGGVVFSSHIDGGSIGILCPKGAPLSELMVLIEISSRGTYKDGQFPVSWRIDEGEVHADKWQSADMGQNDGFVLAGRPAREFALAIARAQNRVAFQTVLDTEIYGVIESKAAISQLFDYCGLPQ